MDKIIEPSQIEALWRAERYVKAWKYIKWANPVVGGLAFGYSFSFLTTRAPEAHAVFTYIHPAIVAAVGLLLLSNIPWRRRAEERQLLLDLAEAHREEVD